MSKMLRIKGGALGGLIALALMAAGCIFTGSGPKPGPSVDPGKPFEVTFRPGDHIRIELSGVGPTMTQIQPRVEEVKGDGTINIEYLNAIHVVGKTAKEVEQIIYTNYVPNIYKAATITVMPMEMLFYVGGQVNHPGSILYNGKITCTKAIQAAGDFTDFADRKNVQLTRANGKVIYVNYDKALKDPALDPEVFPHDQITVDRRM